MSVATPLGVPIEAALAENPSPDAEVDPTDPAKVEIVCALENDTEKRDRINMAYLYKADFIFFCVNDAIY